MINEQLGIQGPIYQPNQPTYTVVAPPLLPRRRPALGDRVLVKIDGEETEAIVIHVANDAYNSVTKVKVTYEDVMWAGIRNCLRSKWVYVNDVHFLSAPEEK